MNEYCIFSIFTSGAAVGEPGTHVITLASRSRFGSVDYRRADTKEPIGYGDNHGAPVWGKPIGKTNTEYIETLSADISVAVSGTANVRAITDGNENAPVPVVMSGGSAVFAADSKYRTTIYLFEVK